MNHIIVKQARDLEVGDNCRMPEGRYFTVLTSIDSPYTEHHMERQVGATIRVGVGWGHGYLFPDELVDVMLPCEQEPGQ